MLYVCVCVRARALGGAVQGKGDMKTFTLDVFITSGVYLGNTTFISLMG